MVLTAMMVFYYKIIVFYQTNGAMELENAVQVYVRELFLNGLLAMMVMNSMIF